MEQRGTLKCRVTPPGGRQSRCEWLQASNKNSDELYTALVIDARTHFVDSPPPRHIHTHMNTLSPYSHRLQPSYFNSPPSIILHCISLYFSHSHSSLLLTTSYSKCRNIIYCHVSSITPLSCLSFSRVENMAIVNYQYFANMRQKSGERCATAILSIRPSYPPLLYAGE